MNTPEPQPPPPLCFVLMPFGKKTDAAGRVTNFDSVYQKVIAPAIEQAGLEPIRADDEKIGGTIHMALGNSYPETGGKNVSALHWDMVCDLRDGGEIHADGEVIYRDGKFLPEFAPDLGPPAG